MLQILYLFQDKWPFNLKMNVLRRRSLSNVTFHGKTNINDFPWNGFYTRLPHGFQTGEEVVLNDLATRSHEWAEILNEWASRSHEWVEILNELQTTCTRVSVQKRKVVNVCFPVEGHI